ncbi:MAG: hypothetical protein AB7N91_23375 [Candidatus Tectimicrobiota bacterium]
MPGIRSRLLLGAALLLTSLCSVCAAQGLSVTLGHPEFYGQITIGSLPPPRVIYPQPIVIEPPAVRAGPAPIYLHVPPGHAKNWRKHCRRYGACGRPVYFVQKQWYQDVYVPHHRERGKDHHGHRDRSDRYHRHRDEERDYRKGHKGHGRWDD